MSAERPGRAGVARAFWRAAWRLSALFAIVFYGVDALTAWRATRFPIHMAWEQAIPYWPPAFLAYFSVLAFPLLVLWLAPDGARVRLWERRMALAVLLAGAAFLALPSQPGYAAHDAGAWSAWAHLARLAQMVAGQHNMLPSLHVGLSLLTLSCVWADAGKFWRAVLAAWWLVMTASVLLTHQHHVADVAAGIALAWALSRRRAIERA